MARMQLCLRGSVPSAAMLLCNCVGEDMGGPAPGLTTEGSQPAYCGSDTVLLGSWPEVEASSQRTVA
ncbi:hypothetical protein CGRA01v4_01851 [Colletotrichum graminicola]|nr:hypothetical protein CGRA01v4_01851 [Colletotrichum graminicola]